MRKSSLVTLVAALALIIVWSIILDRGQTPPANAGQQLHLAHEKRAHQCVQRLPNGDLAEVYC